MRKIFILLFVPVTLVSNAQFYYTPMPPGKADFLLNEKSGIKICYEYRIEDDTRILVSILEYDSKGLPAVKYEKGTNDDGDSVTVGETTYAYDKNLQIETLTTTDMEEGSSQTTRFTRNQKGRVIKKEMTDIDPPTYTYTYDAAGKLATCSLTIRMPTYDEEGEPTGKSFDKPEARMVYKYDSKGRLAEEWYYPADESTAGTVPQQKITWTYNTKNQLSVIQWKDADGAVSRTVRLAYNDRGLLISQVIEFADGEKQEYVYEYCTDCKQSWMK